MANRYSKKFYEEQISGSLQSAREIVPIIISQIKPKSVIDIGCGVGTWLSVFKEKGVKDIFGIDGEWVKKEMLLIPQQKFKSADLKKPFNINSKFDLVVSLEVAEHIPKEFADTFINSLSKLGPVVMFSAAIPFQGGTSHLNEQWPEYWINKFKDRGYIAIDSIRRKIWDNEKVGFFYAQNILLFIKKDYLNKFPALKEELKNNPKPLPIVHPKRYLIISSERNLIAKIFPSWLKGIAYKIFKFFKK